MKKIIFLFFCIFFLGQCTRKQTAITFQFLRSGIKTSMKEDHKAVKKYTPGDTASFNLYADKSGGLYGSFSPLSNSESADVVIIQSTTTKQPRKKKGDRL